MEGSNVSFPILPASKGLHPIARQPVIAWVQA